MKVDLVCESEINPIALVFTVTDGAMQDRMEWSQAELN